MQLEKIPEELKARNQWVVWRLEKRPGSDKPTKPPYNPRTATLASSTKPETWGSFEEAVEAIGKGFDGIGYVVTSDDPYTFIDLDTYKESLSESDVAAHKKIAETFQTYSEVSPSGKGLHLIVRGRVPEGIDRKGVGIYPHSRYMTMTGDVWRDAPILDESPKLEILWKELVQSMPTERALSYQDTEETQPDHEIVQMASNAVNGEKFKNLYEGKWQHDYPSQSEADFALIDMIAFYTKSRSQITRIFRSSALGQRPKAHRNIYVQNMLNRAFDNELPTVDIEGLAAQVKEKIEAKKASMDSQEQPHMNGSAYPEPPQPVVEQEMPAKAPRRPHGTFFEQLGISVPSDPFTPPVGLLGELAGYIYSTATRSVPHIALSGAIALMSGICGRAYNINGTGLNQYLILLAPTGSGKEAMATGVARLMNEVEKKVPAAADFIGPGEIRSDAALFKYIAKNYSFVTISGEFGQTLQQMAAPNCPSTLKGIKRLMLDLYTKSGQGNILRPTIYSDAEKSTKTVIAPAFSFLGESAPEPFYEAVDERMISDGLLPRFTIIEYSGIRPPLNANANCLPTEGLVVKLAALCVQALQINNADTALCVGMNEDARALLDYYDEWCTNKINSDDANEVTRHIWNRAHLRALKLAALVAVGIDAYQPSITYEAAVWAISLSAHNTDALLKRFVKGEVGASNDEIKQRNEVARVIKDYLLKDWNYNSKYMQGAASEKMFWQKVVPYVYINKRLASTSAFKNDRLGATIAFTRTIKYLIDIGVITEIPKQTMFEKFGSTSKAYAIADVEFFQ